jgi:hypothetical protein
MARSRSDKTVAPALASVPAVQCQGLDHPGLGVQVLTGGVS